MNILLIDNNFEGAYGSLNVFIREIQEELLLLKHHVFLSGSVDDSIRYIKENAIDFSLGLGKYNQFKNGVPIYDLLRIMHYQWIIDNPLKIKIDNNSSYIKYIVIDKLFFSCLNKRYNKSLFFPLGVPSFHIRNYENQNRGIVFSGQIRDANKIYSDISEHYLKKKIDNVIEHQIENLEKPYINILNYETNNMTYEQKRQVFMFSNSYLRAYKREIVLSSIKEYPVYIVGENHNEKLGLKKNFTFFGKVNYRTAFKIMARYYFALNIEPNFNDGIHDRVLRSIQNGNMVVTNFNNFQNDLFKNTLLYYQYSSIPDVIDSLSDIHYEEIREKNRQAQLVVEREFGWNSIIQKIIENYRESEINV